MQKMHDTKTDSEKENVEKEIENIFSSLPDEEKDIVRGEFMKGLNANIDEGKKLIDRLDVYLEINDISKYVSLNMIASDYFGKSRSWLHQRLRGYTVNGKPAKFTDVERKRLAFALSDLSKKMQEASLKIA